jgi:hypothetical protein
MAYPTLQPTGREFDPGSYPVKTFRSQSGAESRILYGSKRVDQSLALTYENINDSQAEQFVTHFDEVRGSYDTFTLPAAVRAGWAASSSTIDAVTGAAWRYDAPPQISSVKPGISTVQVKLVGVL